MLIRETVRSALEAASSSREEARKKHEQIQKLLLEYTIAAFPGLEDDDLDPAVVSWFKADHERNVRLNEQASRDPGVLLKSPSADQERARAEQGARRGRRVSVNSG
jgi:hypothetical protein